MAEPSRCNGIAVRRRSSGFYIDDSILFDTTGSRRVGLAEVSLLQKLAATLVSSKRTNS